VIVVECSQLEKLQDAKRELERAEIDYDHAQSDNERRLCREHVRKMTARHERMTFILLVS
jgi:hypothetical protein